MDGATPRCVWQTTLRSVGLDVLPFGSGRMVRDFDVIQTRACQGYRGDGNAEVGTDVRGGVRGEL